MPPADVTVRYFAGARAAAGLPEEPAPAGLSMTELSTLLTQRHGPALGKVLAAASYLVDGLACRDRETPVPPGATIDVLPPFAGG